MRKELNLCEVYDAMILHELNAKAVSILKYKEPYFDELNEDGKKIQKKFGIEKVRIFKNFYEALKAFRELEEKHGLKGAYVEEFVPCEWVQYGFKETFEKHSFDRNELNLDLLTFLAGILQSVRGEEG